MAKAVVASRFWHPPVQQSSYRRLIDGIVEGVAPNWFTAVMGTGIVATSAASLRPPGGILLKLSTAALLPFAVGVWLLAAGLLIVIGTLSMLQWAHRPNLAAHHHHHPVIAHFYGAPPMALLTVGAGTLLVGRHLLGLEAAVRIDWVLWVAGTFLALTSSVTIPFLLFTGQLGRQATRPDAAFGGWLMPVVPPLVSASTGALLLPFCPPGQPRLTLMLCCYAMFGLSLATSLLITAAIWSRLARFGVPEPRMVPTLWIVLGPLGQSVTAAALLAEGADGVIARPFAVGMRVFGVMYGVPAFGFALFWLVLATAITLRTARGPAGLPFAPTWWSYTFPVGTCVTGASALARLSGAQVFAVLATALFGCLVVAWVVVSTRALRSVRIAGTAWAYSI